MAADGQLHPLADGCPPVWACEWGEDRIGVFAGLSVGGVVQRMRWIEPGVFTMGSPDDEAGRHGDEGPQHEVEITRGFWLGETPVTQALWVAVTGENPSRFQQDADSDTRPVERVSWNDCQAFFAHLNDRYDDDGERFALPTEAQWEYACRAGTTGARYGELDEIAWYSKNSGGRTHPVGTKQPNPWGLHDMIGNVWEWCFDHVYRDYSSTLQHAAAPLQDPVWAPAAAAGLRVVRGGSWRGTAGGCRAASRGGYGPGDRDFLLGFRLFRGPPPVRSDRP